MPPNWDFLLQLCRRPSSSTGCRRRYDPVFSIKRSDALNWIESAELAIRSLRSAPRKDKVAFAVLLHFKRRP